MKAFASMLPALVLAAILTATGTASARADGAGDLRDAAIAEVEVRRWCGRAGAGLRRRSHPHLRRGA